MESWSLKGEQVHVRLACAAMGPFFSALCLPIALYLVRKHTHTHTHNVHINQKRCCKLQPFFFFLLSRSRHLICGKKRKERKKRFFYEADFSDLVSRLLPLYMFLRKRNSEPLLHSGRPLNGVKWISARLFADDLCALGAELQRLATLVSSEQHQGGSFPFNSERLQGKPGASSTRIISPSQKSDSNCSGTRICRL